LPQPLPAPLQTPAQHQGVPACMHQRCTCVRACGDVARTAAYHQLTACRAFACTAACVAAAGLAPPHLGLRASLALSDGRHDSCAHGGEGLLALLAGHPFAKAQRQSAHHGSWACWWCPAGWVVVSCRLAPHTCAMRGASSLCLRTPRLRTRHSQS
jgi:hypothetical protein